MVFSSPIFLFLFLPVVLTGYFFLPGLRLKNLWLLGFSLLFYAWGEPIFIFLALLSTLYFVQGLPFGFQDTALPAFMTKLGVSTASIGFAKAQIGRAHV